eukprot:640732-Prymnesium_polylepis.2
MACADPGRKSDTAWSRSQSSGFVRGTHGVGDSLLLLHEALVKSRYTTRQGGKMHVSRTAAAPRR